MIVPGGMQRFDYFLEKLEALMLKATAEKDPALWLYSNDARTPLFMLEGLSRIYAGIHNRKLFKRLRNDFKLLEDGFGQIDYYDAFAKQFAATAGFPPAIVKYLEERKDEKLQLVNELLISNNWFSKRRSRLETIRKRLTAIDWQTPENDVKAIEDFYRKSIKKIKAFFYAYKSFDEVETELHSMRRKLRWLSIYAQALRGLIQLTPVDNADGTLSKYQTPEVVNSPFNKMPDPGTNPFLLLFTQRNFYALSWMVAELGKLKDNALKIIAAAEAVKAVKKCSEKKALKKSTTLLNMKNTSINKTLQDGYAICQQYFSEKNLDYMINDIVPAEKYESSLKNQLPQT